MAARMGAAAHTRAELPWIQAVPTRFSLVIVIEMEHS